MELESLSYKREKKAEALKLCKAKHLRHSHPTVRETKDTFGIVAEDNIFKGNNFLPSTGNDVLDLLFE
ncbi:hypothetical protein SASPL_149929 [Salvia splendens]|uniref:Uncharacterized protein n=1 Tax=Salvia splendens TaxID=180675 RepID=A0A8X8W6J1_SALSN|nr:hypothetical protein SASPL_149929 [Salvia splendens]